eukprot:CAMPEP_0177786716 /NCGR_PEP_ID=MMETSP0491_2-20121128/21080_1 /TAXON_ID=63592 /ORGANISM="Tetraselmis chuii, Strain PLY429" /LENGTH=202 /DNA_ID=CAMNT_0019307963 /DNA_START=1086 /DNA_END=1695 /DNA_ORIENTATION=-
MRAPRKLLRGRHSAFIHDERPGLPQLAQQRRFPAVRIGRARKHGVPGPGSAAWAEIIAPVAHIHHPRVLPSHQQLLHHRSFAQVAGAQCAAMRLIMEWPHSKRAIAKGGGVGVDAVDAGGQPVLNQDLRDEHTVCIAEDVQVESPASPSFRNADTTAGLIGVSRAAALTISSVAFSSRCAATKLASIIRVHEVSPLLRESSR